MYAWIIKPDGLSSDREVYEDHMNKVVASLVVLCKIARQARKARATLDIMTY